MKLFTDTKRLGIVAGVLFALVLAGAAAVLQGDSAYETPQESDLHVRFMMEAYDQIIANYWIRPGSYDEFKIPELPNIFQLALEKAGVHVALATSTRAGTAELFAVAFESATSTEAKRKLALQTLALVLYSLPPSGRGQVLSKQEETQMRQDVANVKPENDLYRDLGLTKGASVADVDTAFNKKQEELAAATSSEAKAELPKVEYAHKVLANESQKQLYDAGQIEPSVFGRILGRTLYASFNKISPTTLQEFARIVDAASTTPNLDSLVLDLRGNVGGALDFTPAFFGLFVGSNQYAFDLYHQGDTNPQRTTFPRFSELDRYAEVVVLTDGMTQSTAELTAAVLKRARVASVVGKRTRGWGSVENTYALETPIDPSTSYALFLVHSLTLRDDQQPIEENGVLPDIDTAEPGWQNRLSSRFASASLISALRQTASGPLR